jgi:hypothetical protein
VRSFTAGGVAATATAVRVFATRQVPFTMVASALLPGNCDAASRGRWPSAQGDRAACPRAASRRASTRAAVVDLQPGRSDALLAAHLSLSAVSYQGLANATFSVGDLMAAANVATLDELLDAPADRRPST